MFINKTIIFRNKNKNNKLNLYTYLYGRNKKNIYPKH